VLYPRKTWESDIQPKELGAMQQGQLHELVPGAGQSDGLADNILPAGEIVRQIAADAEQALEQSAKFVS
jgi:NAD(P)H-dependent flavin oxidoreductase YrpB (nitropropane dioxygenase family)